MDTVLAVILGLTLTGRLAAGLGGTVIFGLTTVAFGLAAALCLALSLALSLGLVQLHGGNVTAVLARLGGQSRELPAQVSARLVDRLEGASGLRGGRSGCLEG